MKKCDLGILLGGPILEQQFNELINLINMHLKGDKDEESVRISIDQIPLLLSTGLVHRFAFDETKASGP